MIVVSPSSSGKEWDLVPNTGLRFRDAQKKQDWLLILRVSKVQCKICVPSYLTFWPGISDTSGLVKYKKYSPLANELVNPEDSCS